MVTKSLFLLSFIVLTVFCLCCKYEVAVPITSSCVKVVVFLPEPPPEDQVLGNETYWLAH
jgi:hypothetical protein